MTFRYITADTHPDYDSISTFRKRFLSELTDLFVQVLALAQALGLLQLGKVSLEGTKIQVSTCSVLWMYTKAQSLLCAALR